MAFCVESCQDQQADTFRYWQDLTEYEYFPSSLLLHAQASHLSSRYAFFQNEETVVDLV